MDLVLRTSIVLLAAWVASRLLSRASAATRHLLWHTSLVIVLTAPVLVPLAPRVAWPGLDTATRALESGLAIATPLRVASPLPSTFFQPLPLRTEAAIDDIAPRASVAAWLWAAGSIALLVWFAVGWWLAWRTARRATLAPASWQLEVTDLAARLRITREVRLGMLASNTSPLTVGLWTPHILLPPAALSWEASDRRAVLLHELAHVRRHDLRIHLMTQAACALYWFNPLVWLAARALKREREHACDDEVLDHGARASAYAACLLHVARLAGRRPPSAALAMARPSELERRFLALLGDRARKPTVAGRTVVLVAVVAGAVAVFGAGVGPVTAHAPTASPVASDVAVPFTRDPSPHQTARRASATLQTSPDPSAREQAALDLADAEPTRSLAALTAALADPSPDVREKAALALGLQSGTGVVEPLIGALTDADGQVREKAALGLALRRDPRVVEPLLAAMQDSDAQVREKAALALGTTGDARARAALEAALQDSDAQVREKAVTGLMLLDTPAASVEGERLRSGLRGIIGAVIAAVR